MFLLNVNDEMMLRMLSSRDAEPLYLLVDESREYLKNWLPWLDDMKSKDDALNFIKNTFFTYNNRTGITAGIFIRNELVGVIAYNKLDFHNRIGTIGYWLGEQYQGRGIMTKAVAVLISYGFEELSLNRIEIRVSSDNLPSRRIPARLGFKEEGCLRQAEWLYDHYVDHIVYGLLKSEWDT